MIDDHTTPPILKSKTLDELHRRQAAQPDPWTMAWIKTKLDENTKAYLGVCHLINTLVMMCQGIRERTDAHDERIKVLEEENQLLMARVGELQAENVLASKRMDDMASWASRIEKDLRKFQHKDNKEGTGK